MNEIWDAASKYLAYRMKTRHQLEMYLQSKEYPEHDISEVLSQFESNGYLDDAEYAAVFISHRIQKGYAFGRIKRELLDLGVPNEKIEAGLERYIDDKGVDPTGDEFERGKREAQKVISGHASIDSKLLAKAGRRLVSLGYRSETIYSILGEYMRGKRE
jgi:SOS response regulatory protein OraA/RecX